MIVTPSGVLASITETLDAQVLPTAPAGWPASYLRSSVMLLTYLQDQIALGPDVLQEANIDLRHLLAQLASSFTAMKLGPELVARLHSEAGHGDKEDDQPVAHERREALLCEAIETLYAAARNMPDNPQLHDLQRALAMYRQRSMDREDRIWARAESLPLM